MKNPPTKPEPSHEPNAGFQVIAIIGGGFTGCEVATSEVKRCVPVTMIDVSDTLLSHAIGHELGQIMTDIHREHGVDVRTGHGVAAQSFTPIPRFWSEHHDTKIQSIGMPRSGTTVTIAGGSVAKRQLVATYTNETGRLVGAVAINAPRALIPYAERVTALPNRRTSDRVISGSARP